MSNAWPLSFVLAARANGHSDDDGRDAAIASARKPIGRHMRDFRRHGRDGHHRYARIDDSDILSMFPDDRREFQAKRITMASAHSSSELVYPKLVDDAEGQPHIREGAANDLSP